MTDTYDRGLEVRREVLGDEHVDRALARRTEFTADFQDLITRYAWGEIWTRPGLDRRTRSCITLTALVAGRTSARAGHARAGRTPERTHARRDQGGAPAERRLLRRRRRPTRRSRSHRRCWPRKTAHEQHRAHAGRDRRRRPCGARPGAPPPRGGDRLGGTRGARPRVRRGADPRRRPRARRTVELLEEMGVAGRLREEGLPHHGFELQFAGARHRIDLSGLTGKHITVYGQQEVVKDLIAARLETGRPLVFEAEDVSLHELESESRVCATGTAARRSSSSATSSPGATVTTAPAGQHPGRSAEPVRARLPLRLARDPGAGPALERGADLLLERARLRLAQHAHTAADASLPPMRPRRGDHGVAGRADLEGITPGSTSTAGRSVRARSSRRA